MLNCYSKVRPDELIFTMIKQNEISYGRKNLTPDKQFLQAGAKKTKAGEFFKPHKHLPCNKEVLITQEAWIILNGKAQGYFYDLNDEYLCSVELESGDCVIIYSGGHSLKILEDETILYEFKNGPYQGADKDKEFIGGKDV